MFRAKQRVTGTNVGLETGSLAIVGLMPIIKRALEGEIGEMKVESGASVDTSSLGVSDNDQIKSLLVQLPSLRLLCQHCTAVLALYNGEISLPRSRLHVLLTPEGGGQGAAVHLH